jgi:hypothetical protein
MSSVNLRRPLMPIKLHANLMTLALKVRRVAAEEEQDRSRREAMADAALKWTDRVLGVLPSNPEACWHLDYHQSWLVRLQCLYAGATDFALRAVPDASAAKGRPEPGAKRARPVPAPGQSQLARQRERRGSHPSRPDTGLSRLGRCPTKKRRQDAPLFLLSFVVPAKAGTHNHRLSLCGRSPDRAAWRRFMPLPRPLPALGRNPGPWRRRRGPRTRSRPSRRCPRSGSRP